MAALLIGYARCSTDQQDLTAQRDGLTALGVADRRAATQSRAVRPRQR
jgi:DNA invertase Pin-like site-specific DNA recombinase